MKFIPLWQVRYLQRSSWLLNFAAVLIMLITAVSTFAQADFNSGSTGADGALIFYTPPEPRIDHVMAYFPPRQSVILFGGHLNGQTITTSWEWNGTYWQPLFPPNSPVSRYNAKVAYNPDQQVLYLFGGTIFNSQTFFNDLWQYDGTNWTEIKTTNVPSQRQDMGLAYDANRKKLVLFGGWFNAHKNDTWEYDGADWKQITTPVAPPARDRTNMVFDPDRKVIVLFGGFGATAHMRDTWEFDGTAWKEIKTAEAPTVRSNFGLVYDPDRKRVVLFGGDGPGLPNDTWEYDGLNWAHIDSAQSPNAPDRTAMAYDEERKQIVLFGGWFPNQFSSLTWLRNGTEWSAPLNTQPFPVIDMSAKPDGIWNYESVMIPKGVTVLFNKNAANSPVIWLVSGNAVIEGDINLNGENAVHGNDPGTEAKGGPGGYNGGLGGIRQDVSGSFAGTAGQGPGGGSAGTSERQPGGNGGHLFAGQGELGGQTYGSRLLVPLMGGSGGGGGASAVNQNGGSGGGGGGAILIASSGSIVIHGKILASGGLPIGNASTGGRGSGGAIRLIADAIEGTGGLNAEPNGRIRLETFLQNLTGQILPAHVTAPPLALNFTPPGAITITHIAGQVVPLSPSGNTGTPDVVFQEAGEITVSLSTQNVAQGTELFVRVSARGQVQTVRSTPVDANGQATVTLIVPAGVGTIQAFSQGVFQ